ncbi:MAG: hypothetical protein EBT24_10685 [Betaproteobacteria bacterium]|nr:hypothetical protein [Betaproteobacteria bacterium]
MDIVVMLDITVEPVISVLIMLKKLILRITAESLVGIALLQVIPVLLVRKWTLTVISGLLIMLLIANLS